VIIAFLAMVSINALANILPINNITTGEVSDSYPDLFAPAGITFSIWGFIYLLLGVFILYQLGVFGSVTKKSTIQSVNVFFLLSSLANIAWIFSWHYDLIALSLICMCVILYSLIRIAHLLAPLTFTRKEYVCVRLPFSIYFGWITIATIANVTALLVSLNWDGFGVAESTWMIVVLCIGTIIGVRRMLADKDLAFGLVFIWAYTGILIKHLSSQGFAGQYAGVILTTILCMAVFVIIGILLLFRNRRAKPRVKNKTRSTN
jgi:hypothetical protein